MDTDQLIVEKLISSHLKETVQIIETLEPENIAAFLAKLPVILAAKIISYMNNYKGAKCLELLDLNFAVELTAKIDLLSLELLLRQCDTQFLTELLDRIPPEVSEKLRQKLKYPANSVGEVMDQKVFSMPKDITVKKALKILKREKELVSTEIFVTNEQNRIEGIIKLPDLFLANEADLISASIKKEIPKFYPDEPLQAILNHLAWVEYRTIPVVDRSDILIGSIRFEDIQKTNLIKDQELSKQLVETGNALGELYRIGLTGLLQSTGR